MASITDSFQEWLSKIYQADIARLNERYGSTYASFAQIPIENFRPANTNAAAD